jgi:serine/threonine-protein kinase
MGAVYLGYESSLDRRVAIKVLPAEFARDPDLVRRFRAEATAAARLIHPNIIQVYFAGEHAGHHFFAMQYVDGVSLAQLLRRGNRPTVDQSLAIIDEVLSGLVAAHRLGFVHRDIKPGNIVVSSEGQVKVLDFGLARRFKTADTHELGLEGSTMPGRPMGTANYMAPERILQLPLDPRSDLFSLGVVIFEMATGRLPFAGASPSETVANVLDKQPVPLTSLAPQHPKGLEQVVERLLAKKAGDRYPAATELTAALLSVASPHPRLIARLRRRFLGS